MKKIIDQEKVAQLINELNVSAKALEHLAGPVFHATGADVTFRELIRVYDRGDLWQIREAARACIGAAADRAGRKHTVDKEFEARFMDRVTSGKQKIFKDNPHFQPDAFTFSKGKVTVNEKVKKEIRNTYTIDVDDETERYFAWMKSFAAVLNTCPNDGFRRDVIRRVISKNWKPYSVEVKGNELIVKEPA
jgi:hypothetical protein